MARWSKPLSLTNHRSGSSSSTGSSIVRRARAQRKSALLMNDDPDPRVKDAARRRLLDITQFLDADRPPERLELAEAFLSLGIMRPLHTGGDELCFDVMDGQGVTKLDSVVLWRAMARRV